MGYLKHTDLVWVLAEGYNKGCPVDHNSSPNGWVYPPKDAVDASSEIEADTDTVLILIVMLLLLKMFATRDQSQFVILNFLLQWGAFIFGKVRICIFVRNLEIKYAVVLQIIGHRPPKKIWCGSPALALKEMDEFEEAERDIKVAREKDPDRAPVVSIRERAPDITPLNAESCVWKFFRDPDHRSALLQKLNVVIHWIVVYQYLDHFARRKKMLCIY